MRAALWLLALFGIAAAVALAQQVHTQLHAVELPRIDETLATLATAAAGR